MLCDLGDSLGTEVVVRPIERSELYIADEVGLTGTLVEVTPILSIDDRPLPDENPLPVESSKSLPQRRQGRGSPSGRRAGDGSRRLMS